MRYSIQATNQKAHLKSTLKGATIFNESALEIAILDRWGNPIWEKAKHETEVAISWNGLDRFGQKVAAGSYLCKITYPDNFVVYVPFVFLQK